MSNEIIKKKAEAVQQILSSKAHEKSAESTLMQKIKNKNKVLLIDVSGSMSDRINSEATKWSIMNNIIQDLTGFRRFAFNDDCYEILENQRMPHAWAGTAMHRAFDKIKNENLKEVILVTDGFPDNAELALKSAEGLKMNIIYIGPLPVPDFLNKLASQCSGIATPVDLIKEGGIKFLENKIKGLLNG